MQTFLPPTTKLNISQILTQHTPPNVQFQHRAQNPKAQLVKQRPITMQAGRMLEKFFFQYPESSLSSEFNWHVTQQPIWTISTTSDAYCSGRDAIQLAIGCVILSDAVVVGTIMDPQVPFCSATSKQYMVSEFELNVLEYL